ncbi:MAG: hypothetical protein JWO18_2595 [Microbacteriaceae bacterium]|nr:hypothetical protein [Microbacteriaceae bacterium]
MTDRVPERRGSGRRSATLGASSVPPMNAATTGRRERIEKLIRHPWLILTAWTLLVSLAHIGAHGNSWHYFVTGAKVFVSPDILSLYAHHPELQMGPLTFVMVSPFVLLLPWPFGEIVVMVLIAGVGLLVASEIRKLMANRASTATWLIVSLLVVTAWAELAIRFAHLDDAMALYLSVLGLRLMRSGRPLLSSAMLALAVDFKPWAVPFVALLLLAASRKWVPLGALWVAIVLVVWTPFVIGNPGTIGAAKFGIPIETASTLHFLGLPDHLTPSWDRYAQVVLALALAALAIARKRWAAVFLIVIVVRLLLDPGTKNYYDVGLVIGAAIFDLALSSAMIPWATITASALVYLPSYLLVDVPLVRGIARTAALLLLLGAAFLWRKPPSESPSPSVQSFS